MDFILQLIDTLAWPVTLLAIVFGFRKNFSNSINRLTNINAGASGVTVSFSDKIAAAKSQIEQLRTGVVSKSAPALQQNLSTLQTNLDEKVAEFGNREKITLQAQSPLSQVNELKEKGVISIEKAKEIEVIQNLLRNVDSSISDSEAKEIKQMIDKVCD